MYAPKMPLTEPCHCGSGRKYKNCCRRTEKKDYAIGRSAIERTALELSKFIHEECNDLLLEIEQIVFENIDEDYSEADVDRFHREYAEAIFLNITDLAASESPAKGMQAGIDLFVEERRDKLNPMALEYLTNQRSSSLSLYEVVKVHSGKTVSLRNMFSGKNFEVIDRQMSDHALIGHVLILRIVPVGEEYLRSEAFYGVPRLSGEHAVRQIRKMKRDIPGSRTVTWNRFFKKYWYTLPILWFNGIAAEYLNPTAGMVNTDHEPIEMQRLIFHLKKGSSFTVSAKLVTIPDVSKESPDTFVLVSDRSDDDSTTLDNILISTLRLSEGELKADVNSSNRAKYVTRLLFEHLSDHIENMSVEDLDIDPRTMSPDSNKEELPQEVKEELLTQVLDKHYKQWMDIPIPALDHMSPRNAVKQKSMKERLIALLLDYEQRAPMDGVHYDLSWVWEELGLKRP